MRADEKEEGKRFSTVTYYHRAILHIVIRLKKKKKEKLRRLNNIFISFLKFQRRIVHLLRVSLSSRFLFRMHFANLYANIRCALAYDAIIVIHGTEYKVFQFTDKCLLNNLRLALDRPSLGTLVPIASYKFQLCYF